jgi:hypothetical protein
VLLQLVDLLVLVRSDDGEDDREHEQGDEQEPDRDVPRPAGVDLGAGAPEPRDRLTAPSGRARKNRTVW